MLGLLESNSEISNPKSSEYSVGVIVRLIGTAVSTLCTTRTLITPVSSRPSLSVSSNSNFTTVCVKECLINDNTRSGLNRLYRDRVEIWVDLNPVNNLEVLGMVLGIRDGSTKNYRNKVQHSDKGFEGDDGMQY